MNRFPILGAPVDESKARTGDEPAGNSCRGGPGTLSIRKIEAADSQILTSISVRHDCRLESRGERRAARPCSRCCAPLGLPRGRRGTCASERTSPRPRACSSQPRGPTRGADDALPLDHGPMLHLCTTQSRVQGTESRGLCAAMQNKRVQCGIELPNRHRDRSRRCVY